MNKLSNLSSDIKLLRKKLIAKKKIKDQALSNEDLVNGMLEQLDRYTNHRIIEAWKILYPNCAAFVACGGREDMKHSIPFVLNKERLHMCFNALYPIDEKEVVTMPDNKDNSKMNDFIRQQAGIPVKADNPDKNIIDSSLIDTDADKEDINELIRNSYKSTNQELKDLLFKRSE